MYVQFGYRPLTIWDHTQGQVSGSMNADQINMIQKSQQSTNKGFNEELEEDFIPRKEISWIQKVWTPNFHPCHYPPQTCGGNKSVCPVWIRPTDNFLTHLGESFSINERWYNQWKQTGQEPMT